METSFTTKRFRGNFSKCLHRLISITGSGRRRFRSHPSHGGKFMITWRNSAIEANPSKFRSVPAGDERLWMFFKPIHCFSVSWKVFGNWGILKVFWGHWNIYRKAPRVFLQVPSYTLQIPNVPCTKMIKNNWQLTWNSVVCIFWSPHLGLLSPEVLESPWVVVNTVHYAYNEPDL